MNFYKIYRLSVTLITIRVTEEENIIKVIGYIRVSTQKYGVDIRNIEQPIYSIHKKDPNDFLVSGLMELLDQYQRLEIEL